MKRRNFLKNTALFGVAGLTLPTARLYGAVEGGYSGRLLVQLQADGGWDVASYCDPKINQTGEKEITNWSKNNDIQQAGNIPFAPFADNAAFFEKYFQDMLVINGVDMQTNSHDTGIIHNWSGRNSIGYPTLTAMFSAHNAPNQPLSYINFGGFGQTGNLIRFSRLDDVSSLKSLLRPELDGPENTLRNADDLTRIRAAAKARLERQLSNTNLTPRKFRNLKAQQQATTSRSILRELSTYLPKSDEIIADQKVNSQTNSSLQRQIQLTVSAFDAGVASASDLFLQGFDTHNNHDADHEPLLQHLNESIDLLWTSAEKANIADRLTVIIGSDFSRTPHYNEDGGKDHWAVGSVIIMEKNPSWGNQVIGSTDEQQNAYRFNPKTLKRDETKGTYIHPKHVHKSLRRYLGLENTAVDQDFKFLATEDFDFFG
jgi:hypothetical protein